MKRLFIILVIMVGLGWNSTTLAQDAFFSLYENNPVYLNAAKIGRYTKKTFIANQRLQSSVSSSKYNTSQFTFVLPVYLQMNYAEKSHVNHKGGIGISVYNDNIGGAFKTTGANVNFAYNWLLDKTFKHLVSFGLYSGYEKLAVDYNNYTWGEQYDPELGYAPGTPAYAVPDYEKSTVFDVGFGVLWSFRNKLLELKGIRNVEAGISLSHLNSPGLSFVENSNANLSLAIKIHSSLYYSLSEKYFTGVKLFYIQQESNRRVNIGGTFGVNFEKSGNYISETGRNDASFILKEAYLDVWASENKSFGIGTNFDFSNYKIGFSFESNYSTFTVNNKLGTAFEISLQAGIPDFKK